MATRPAKPQKKSKLERLKEKMSNIGNSSKGYFNPKEGANTIRILPDVGGMDFFFQPVGKHYLTKEKWVYCPSFISDGELDCPVCEMVQQYYKLGDKETAGNLRVQKKFWMNVIDRENEDAGPLVFTPGIIIMQTISTIINDPDYGEIYDVDDGVDIVISRSGKGKETSYEVIAKRKSTPLAIAPDGGPDDEKIDKWISEAKDLSYVVLTDNPEEDAELTKGATLWVYPYNRILKEYDLDMDAFDELDEEYDEVDEDDIEEDEPEEVVEEKPTRSTRIRRRTR